MIFAVVVRDRQVHHARAQRPRVEAIFAYLRLEKHLERVFRVQSTRLRFPKLVAEAVQHRRRVVDFRSRLAKFRVIAVEVPKVYTVVIFVAFRRRDEQVQLFLRVHIVQQHNTILAVYLVIEASRLELRRSVRGAQ